MWNGDIGVMREKSTEKAAKIVLEKGVKLHQFKPSNRQIWTVVGKDNEYWVDSDNSYCSCRDYYFQTLSGREKCYHLQVIEEAKAKNLIDVIEFSDDEYYQFIRALIQDLRDFSTR